MLVYLNRLNCYTVIVFVWLLSIVLFLWPIGGAILPMLLFFSPGKTTTQTLRRVLPYLKTPQLAVLSAKYQYVSIQYSIGIYQYVIIQSNVFRIRHQHCYCLWNTQLGFIYRTGDLCVKITFMDKFLYSIIFVRFKVTHTFVKSTNSK